MPEDVLTLYDVHQVLDRDKVEPEFTYPREVLSILRSSFAPLIFESLKRLVESERADNILRDASHCHVCHSYTDLDPIEGARKLIETKKGIFLYHLYEFDREHWRYPERNVIFRFDGSSLGEAEILRREKLDTGELLETISPGMLGITEPDGFTAYFEPNGPFELNNQRFYISWIPAYFKKEEKNPKG